MRDDFSGGIPASEFMRVCGLFDRDRFMSHSSWRGLSPGQIRERSFCLSYFGSFIEAIQMDNILAMKQINQPTLLCVKPADPEFLIEDYKKYMQSHQELMSRNMDYTVYAMLNEMHSCKAQGSVSRTNENSKPVLEKAVEPSKEKICASNGECVSANFVDDSPASGLIDICEPYIEKSEEYGSVVSSMSVDPLDKAAGCEGYFAGFISAMTINAFITKQETGSLPMLCPNRLRPKTLIEEYMKFMKEHPEKMPLDTGYTIYATLEQTQSCKK
jgi:hypothetical protein